MAKGKPGRRAPWLALDDYNIVALYGSKYRGIAQYYMLAGDIRKMHRLRWVMENFHAQDPGRETRVLGIEDGGTLQSQN